VSIGTQPARRATPAAGAASALVSIAGSLADRLRSVALELQAFVASRLLIIAAGIAGVLRLPSLTSPAAARVAHHQLSSVGYLLGASVDRFDSAYFLAIATQGYGRVSSDRLAFYPGYPLVIRVVGVVCGSPVLAGALTSAGAFLAALVMLRRLTELELGRQAARATVLLLAFAPLSFFFTAIYSESLFLALSVGSLLAARTGRWRLACGLGAVAGITRITGLALLPALAIMRIRERGGFDRGLGWLLALPGVFVGNMAVLAVAGHSPTGMFSAEGAWHRVMVGPVGGLVAAAVAAARGAVGLLHGAPAYRVGEGVPFTLPLENLVLMIVLVMALLALWGCRRRLAPEYLAYALAVMMVCLSSPVPGEPLGSFDRFALTIFPLWMVAGAWVARRRLVPIAVLLGSLALVFYTSQFAAGIFVA